MRTKGALCLTALLAAAPLAADDWPQWRGPGRDGHSAELAAALGWGETGPRELWRLPGGAGFSSLTAVGERLFTAWVEEGDEVAVALDAGDGQLLWRTSLGAAYENERGGGPRSTPTFDRDRLFLVSGRGVLAALSVADGRVLWRRDLVEEMGAKIPIWGFAASPLVAGERVIVPVGGAGQAVAAFDRADGRLLWSAHDDAIGYSSSMAFELAGTRQIVTVTGQSVSGLSPEGEVLWSYPWPVINNISVASPIQVSASQVFISTSYDVGAALLEISRTEDGYQARPAWRDRVMKNHFQDSVLHRGHLFGFDNASLKCIDAATGTEHWRRRGFGKGQLLLAGERLIVLGERGRLALVAADPERYEELATAALPSRRYWTPPTLAGGRLFVRDESEVVALDLRSDAGEAIVRRPAPGATVPGEVVPAAELVRRNLEARGGDEAWQKVEALRLSGRFNRNGRESRITVWRRGPERVRVEVAFGDLTETFVYDGERGRLRPFRGRGGEITGAELRLQLDLADLYLPWRDLLSRSEPLEALGAADGGGEPAHRLRVGEGALADEWLLSARTHQVIQAIRGPAEDRVTIYAHDYRPVQGMTFPHYVEVSFGTGLYSLSVERIEVNPELPEGWFESPG